MALNIITAKFCSGATQAWASEAWQYDYGQVLQFDGLELPEAYQVHFSNVPMTGTAITQIGGADGVTVPDQYFATGEPVYAWVYLHEGEDDGETVYMVTIPVKKRPQPSDEVPTPEEQSAIDQAIAALNIAVEKADEAITHYPTIIDGTWHVWDVTTEAYVDTGVQAQGAKGDKGNKGDNGISPTVTVTDITNGHRVTITDADGMKTFDVMNGAQGDPGGKGDPGAPGTSPTVTVTEITGGHRVTITDESGEHTFDVLDGEDGTTPTVDSAMSSTSENPVQNKVINAELTDIKSNLNELKERVDAIEDAEGLERYGVSGIGQSASALTRLYDAVGMVTHVGTDGDNSAVRNDFDEAAPWKWRKCVGHWTAGEDRAIFHVHAYQGDDDYTEDGSNGDFVAVECPISYYKRSGNTLVISAHRYDGYRPFDIFCHNHNPQDTIPYYYRPAYSLAMKDGKAVSLPGLDNEQGSYKRLMDAARTYDGGELGNLPFLYPMALSFYDWAMYTVEFAVQNCQSIMQGCAGLRHNNDDRLTFRDATHVLVRNWFASRVVGEYIAILPTDIEINRYEYKATHRITGVTRCTADGTASASGTYTLLELEDLGKEYFTYDLTGATEYRIAGRPYRTGSCSSVSTPSGSPVSNTNAYYPMKYRWVENLFGNQYKTVADFFNKRVGTGDDDYYLEYYYLPKPHEYVPSSTSKPDATDLATDAFVKLGIETEHANYINGYVRSKKYDEEYPDLWIPHETTGASASTYYADYAYLVISSVVRSVRLYGYWSSGAYVGLSLFYGHHAQSYASAYSGGDLCFPQ